MRSVILGLVVATSVACYDDSIVGSPSVTGTYTLRTINGSPLPYVLSETATSKIEVLDRAFTLHQGSTYAESGHLRRTENGETTIVSTPATGTYRLEANSVSFQRNGGSSLAIAIVNGNTMTFVEPGMTLMFRK